VLFPQKGIIGSKMLRVLISSLLVSAAVGFVPASSVVAKGEVSLKVSRKTNQERSEALPWLPRPQNLKGWAGDVGFDPFYFSDNIDMNYLREAELKHGRLGSAAWLGWVSVDLGARMYPFPSDWKTANSHQFVASMSPKDALKAHPNGFWDSPLIWPFVFMICVEAWAVVNKDETREPGDIGWDFLGFLKDRDEKDVKRMKVRELKNTRLGMLAFIGVLAQTNMGAEVFPYVKFPSS